ncbi:MAG: hypothetical protein IT322_05175 [Anaerolineae bacterium]|nr:hypothetical protein [Anaerolineae bacterium]
MHAVPTVYRGKRFRSRLEARFVAELDKRGIHWRYEPKRVGKDEQYLLDFYLPDCRCWVEVKGRMSALDEEQLPAIALQLFAKDEKLFVFMSDNAYLVNEGMKLMSHERFWLTLTALLKPPAPASENVLSHTLPEVQKTIPKSSNKRRSVLYLTIYAMGLLCGIALLSGSPAMLEVVPLTVTSAAAQAQNPAVKQPATLTLQGQPRVKVLIPWLIVRPAPGERSTEVTQLKQGTEAAITAYTIREEQGEVVLWWQIDTPEKLSGWVVNNPEYLQVEGVVFTEGKPTNVEGLGK